MILTSLAARYLAFGEWSDLLSFLGIGLIMSSGLYTRHRERLRAGKDVGVPVRLAAAGEAA